MCMLRRDFHTLINNLSFSSTIDVESHNPPFTTDVSFWVEFDKIESLGRNLKKVKKYMKLVRKK